MKRNSCFIDHAEQTIYCTSEFMKRAGIWGTEEYNHLLMMKKDLPEYELVRKNVSESKKVYKKLTIERMRSYVEFKDGADSDAMKAFDEVCTEAKIRGHAYPRVKSWFIHKYKDYASDPTWNTPESNAENNPENNTENNIENSAA